jgi:hypothetical protein
MGMFLIFNLKYYDNITGMLTLEGIATLKPANLELLQQSTFERTSSNITSERDGNIG